MIVFLMGAGTPLFLGYCLVRLLAPRLGLALQLSLGAGIGAGLLSCFFFISRVAGILPLIPETAALAAAGYFLIKAGPAHRASAIPWNRNALLFAGIFGIVAVTAFLAFLSTVDAAPNGLWDASAIWNLKARFLASPVWRDAFSPVLRYSHPDYPLLVSGFVARIWMAAGGPEMTAPEITAALFTFATVGVLVSSLSALKNRAQGFAAGTLLAATHLFAVFGAAQYADIPLGFFLLSTLALFSTLAFHADRAPESGWKWFAVLPGLTAGLAVWTKNEAWVFLLAAMIFCVLLLRKTGRRYSRLLSFAAAGLAPVLVIVLYFKFAFPSANDFVGGRSLRSITILLTSPGRYLELGNGLLSAFGGLDYHKFQLAVAGVAVCALFGAGVNGARDRFAAGVCAAVLAIVFAGYCATVLISPWDIRFQVASALDRLLLQLLPAALFTAFLALPTLE